MKSQQRLHNGSLFKFWFASNSVLLNSTLILSTQYLEETCKEMDKIKTVSTKPKPHENHMND